MHLTPCISFHIYYFLLNTYIAIALLKPLYGVTEGLGYHDSPRHLSKCRTVATADLVSDYKPRRRK
jgi:hypothetical protein